MGGPRKIPEDYLGSTLRNMLGAYLSNEQLDEMESDFSMPLDAQIVGQDSEAWAVLPRVGTHRLVVNKPGDIVALHGMLKLAVDLGSGHIGSIVLEEEGDHIIVRACDERGETRGTAKLEATKFYD